MVRIKDYEVAFLERAKRAIKNSYTVGEINTTEGDFAKGAKALGSNIQPFQSHDAFLSGIVVIFEIESDDNELLHILSGTKFIELNKIINSQNYIIKTNYRCLKHLIISFRKQNKFSDFIDNCISLFPEFNMLCFSGGKQ